MKTLASILMTTWVVTQPFASAAETGDELRRRCDEQERQIRRLELENGRLRELLNESREAPVEPNRTDDLKRQAETLAPATPTHSAPTATPAIHTVKAGETLSSIAKQHGTTSSKLAQWNGLKNEGLIRVGQKLKVESASPSVAQHKASTEAVTHQVRSGETYYSIARRHGITVDALTRANPKVNPNALRIGQSLTIRDATAGASPAKSSPAPAQPAPAPREIAEKAPAKSSQTVSQPARFRSIHLKEKTTFGEFAAHYGTTPDKLNALNGLNLEAKQVLAEGSELYIPAQPQ
ncbi:LysM repeat protein [Haloferula luteola]|uniref:LysM repeat protein n=1 Tax=Haloferula luteola TaxID=595692 RepID=A0A840UZ31_9BACT|nr:LysM peptidoglycan-binding domain-containing protein [Haloferula luteola]MBB5350086.1 LysM repeat protein [Haloferula luteola]